MLKRICSSISLLLLFLSASAQAGLMVSEQKVRLLPPSAPNTAAYMQLMNHTNKPMELVGVSSDVAERTEIHTMVEHNGMMRMQQLTSLVIEPMASVALKPGGNHIMLIGLKQPLSAGDEIAITLEFADGSQHTVKAKASAEIDAKDSGEHHHHHHHH
ncbi:copper chaperone PCu(A)C [Paraferrimonas sedimenticola]|nr:copper chaperone PCu(A)C [Paraferrimonas sedimenticola]